MADTSPLEFFDALFPGPLPGKLALYTTTLDKGTVSNSWLYNLGQADRLCAKFTNTRRLLFGVALQSKTQALALARERRGRAAASRIRGGEASAVALPALWVEIPFGAAPLPPGRTQALSVLAAVEQPPSIVISAATATGGVIYAFWLFEELWLFDLADPTASERLAAKALLVRLRWAIAALAAEHGWLIDARCDLAGTCPVPGSVIGAAAGGPRAVVDRFPLIPGEGRFRRLDFASLPEPPAEEPQQWRRLLNLSESLPPPRPTYDFRPIADGCTYIRHCLTERASLSRRQLANAVRLLAWCEAPGADRRQLVHAVSGGHPGYDPYDVDQKLAAVLRAPSGPITCRRLGAAPGVAEQHCSRCAHFGRIASPVELDRGAAAVVPTVADAGTADEIPGAPEPERPRIVITTRQHEVNDQALAALTGGAELFEHAGALVEVLRAPGVAPVIRRVSRQRLQELLSRHCDFALEAGGREPRAAAPPRWTIRALLARGRWPELPRLAADAMGAGAAAPTGADDEDLRAARAALDARFLAGLEQVLDALGGAATARQINRALAAEPERFAELAAAFERLWPGLAPGDPAAAAVLGYRLRGLKGRAAGGRVAAEARRGKQGIAWAVRPCHRETEPFAAGPHGLVPARPARDLPPPANDLEEVAAA